MVSSSWLKLTEAVVGLWLVLMGVSWGVETYCDGRKDGAQCFGPLGGKVVIQLMNNASELPIYEWKHNTAIILKCRRNNLPPTILKSRYIFIPSNGTLSITNLNRSDGGKYTLETFGSDGKNLGTKTLQLIVEAPFSSVQLEHECLSQGLMNVSCLSEGGDSPQYSWTLDGHTLTDSELLSGNNETNIIVLRQNISGRLVCSVRNQVSLFLKEIQISTCGFINCSINGTQISNWVFLENNSLCVEPTTVPSSGTPNIKISVEHWPIIGGTFGVLLIILVVSFAIICVRRKKQNNRVEEDDGVLANGNGRRRQEEQYIEVQAEYSQVKKKPQHSDVILLSHSEDVVYAKVHKKNP